jgi:hypothetical protein
MRFRPGVCFLSLLVISFSSAVFLDTSVYPHEDFGKTTLYYSVSGTNNSDIMETYLMPCVLTSGISCPLIQPCGETCPQVDGTLVDRREVSGEGSFLLRLSSEPGLYKVCSRLVSNPNYDCGGDNYFVLLDTDISVQTNTEYVYINTTEFVEKTEPTIEIYSVPTIIGLGEDFEAVVYVNNPTDENLSFTAYTFAYEEGECVTFNCWDENVNFSIEPGKSKRIVFENSFTKQGNFTFKARMKVDNETYTDSIMVEVKSGRDIRFYFIYNNTHIGYRIKNDGPEEENISLVALYDDVLSETVMLDPFSETNLSFERKGGWLYLFLGKEVLDFRSVWEYKETSQVGPTGFYVANPNDLNIPLVLISIIGLAYLAWKI